MFSKNREEKKQSKIKGDWVGAYGGSISSFGEARACESLKKLSVRDEYPAVPTSTGRFMPHVLSGGINWTSSVWLCSREVNPACRPFVLLLSSNTMLEHDRASHRQSIFKSLEGSSRGILQRSRTHAISINL